jgi:hypothetical protein
MAHQTLKANVSRGGKWETCRKQLQKKQKCKEEQQTELHTAEGGQE